MFEMSDPVIVEWRALTIAYLDLVAERVRSTMKLSKKTLSLTQLIEGGTTSVSSGLLNDLNKYTYINDLFCLYRLEENLPRSLVQIRNNHLL